MEIVDRKSFSPIKLLPGDVVSCTYEQKAFFRRRQRTVLADYTCTEEETIDTAIIVRLDDDSLKALGLKSGLAGIFGESE